MDLSRHRDQRGYGLHWDRSTWPMGWAFEHMRTCITSIICGYFPCSMSFMIPGQIDDQ